ncbi:MAG: cobalt-precorrin-5B (C(1))-methyltransferase CbiD [Candidatus Adiutrix sp.]|jgi:cobalt-precorrin-5B (C1)-methyltransferase|nr:cobalt-precorrin-5B (C(1))-methyltransferase CbiD [Candidatus Adiutrix sp.]
MPGTKTEPDEDPRPPVDPGKLRSGFSTGTAATAAALAGALILSGRPSPERVTVRLPGGRELSVAVAQASIVNSDEALAVVIKDAGDDPDVTNGAAIGALVRRRTPPGLIHILGGRGVGRITKPGLILPPGQWAINPVPRAMIRENLEPLLKERIFPGVEVEIFVENGEKLAARTLNPRLGISGGISILGTTGLVKPFSNEAYLATIESALDVARAAGTPEVIFTTGRQSEKLAIAERPDLRQESFIQMADFFGDSLKQAVERGFSSLGLAVFFGKAVKQAAGHYNTHAHKNDQDTAALADWLSAEISRDLGLQIRAALTARAALDLLRAGGRLGLTDLVARRALGQARRLAGPTPKLWMSIFDYDGSRLSHLED